MSGTLSMKGRARSTLLVSALLAAFSTAGCSGASLDRRPGVAGLQARVTVAHVEKALASKDFPRALQAAERLVAAAPRDAGYRALLGRAYLANGRYLAARTAFSDAMTLGNRDVRTIISLALVKAGVGDDAGARALLSENIENLPAGDYGLAMAIAGDPREGVRALLEAVKMDDATARTRQNLAYAFALSGDWTQAQLVGAQDMDRAALQQRLLQWSQVAREGAEPLRVAALIGVPPRFDDAGLPERLALRAEPLAPLYQAPAGDIVQEARAHVEAKTTPPVPVVQLAAVVEHPRVTLAPPVPPVALPEAKATEPTQAPKGVAPPTLAAAFAPLSSAVPLVRAQSEPMREALKVAFARKVAGSVVGKLPKPASALRASDWVVQLGAYNSSEVAAEKWQRLREAHKSLAGYSVVNSRVWLQGRTFYRVALGGFEARADAVSLCTAMQARGQSCFVRTDRRAGAGAMARASTAPRSASRAARRQVASR
ncbi:SPOR domain-containing protein [Sphingobium sp. CR28]|uniref:SPOR domain-containing protein n=1 Tax=Sphingobium sp. CR28 TaxID=3400272 RepID=UPI003FF0920D